ncbi:MAG: hypothetical protein AUG46_00445 [Acidobacteria bacterium 13_1_20CM_3_58_11]|nr:MAG: hypothetical protein AUG46_00445 [Acidobacteria bacterium 13_1_20CM_3_58_11]
MYFGTHSSVAEDWTLQMTRNWKRKTLQFGVAVLVIASICLAQQIQVENIPDEVLVDVQTGTFERSYALNGHINPFYLRGDFDGDGKADYAFAVISKKDKTKGIGIWLSSQKRVLVLGAGHPFEYAVLITKDMNFDVWKVYGKREVEQGVTKAHPQKLVGEAILVGKSESASGLVYWTGKAFTWYQQGD